jgi:C4-dicarboxylate-specific signal transduction histidine kinase
MEPMDIIEGLITTGDIHNLRIDIQGIGQVLINQQSLNSICDNLFGNYIDQNRRNPEIELKIEISIIDTDTDLEISIKDHNGKPCLRPERLFEPFWSEKGDGLCIGFYHARQLAQEAGGTLQAITPNNNPMIFMVALPKSV